MGFYLERRRRKTNIGVNLFLAEVSTILIFRLVVKSLGMATEYVSSYVFTIEMRDSSCRLYTFIFSQCYLL